jgi:DNA polymerase-3 subunit delta'
MVRENFIFNFQAPELNYLAVNERDFSTRFSPYINERNVIGIMEELSLAERDITQNVNPRMVFFDFALKMIVLLIK